MNERRWNALEQDILDLRSRVLAAPTAHEKRPAVDAVCFVVAGERYAVEAAVVHGVAVVKHLASLPHAPPELAGLASRSGVVLPVFHMHAILELPRASLGKHHQHSPVLFIGSNEPELGLAVDAIEAVHPIDVAHLHPTPADLGPGARGLVRGLAPNPDSSRDPGTRSGGPLLLDGTALLATDRLYVNILLPS